MRLMDIAPGSTVRDPLGKTALLVTAEAPHPLYPALRLAVWAMPDDRLSLDALDPRQDVGEVIGSNHEERVEALRQALWGPHVWNDPAENRYSTTGGGTSE